MFIEDKKDKVFIPQTQNTITANDYNQIKNEIQKAIELAGMTPEKDVIQLPEALKTLTQQSGAEEVAKIEAAGQEQLDAVNAAGGTQMNNINTAGAQAVQDAQAAANTATSKASEAATSAGEAAASASSALTSQQAAASSASSAGTAKTAAESAKTAAQSAQRAAESAQAAAETAKTQAASSASAADNSASAASQSAKKCQELVASVGDPAAKDLSNVTSISNSSAVQAALNGKAAKDLSNGTKATQANINNIMPNTMDYVVESYSDESGNWYRVYKSGWVAQGGMSNTLGGSAKQTVTFFKPMSNANYSTNIASTPGGLYTGCGVSAKTSTSMRLHNASQASVKLSWFIIGQGAE